MKEIVEKRAEILKAIAQPTRLKILELLRDGERCVCEMLPVLKEEQANISKHLSLLRQAGIVDARKEGVWSYYKIRNREVFEIIDKADKIVRKEMLKTIEMAKGIGIKG